MRKGVHLISWCASRMAHFLSGCEKANDLLVPLYNTMYSCDIKQEEQDRFFHLENIYILKLMNDIHKEFYIEHLRPVDKEDLHTNMVYYAAQSFSRSIGNIEIMKADDVAGTIELDGNGNLPVKEKMNDTDFTIRLSSYHKPNRNKTKDEKIEQLQANLLCLKSKITDNLQVSIEDQTGEDTYYYYWSALDLSGEENT